MNTLLAELLESDSLSAESLKPFIYNICDQGRTITVLRLDLIDAKINGNKVFKLRHHIRAYAQGNYRGIVSVGGVHSNHISALSAWCQQQKIPLVLLIRGHEGQALSPTLKDLQRDGSEVRYLDRQAYQDKTALLNNFITVGDLQDYYPIPEGGSGSLGLKGCIELGECLQQLIPNTSQVFLPAGTGCTSFGLAQGLSNSHKVCAVSALKNQDSIIAEWATYQAGPDVLAGADLALIDNPSGQSYGKVGSYALNALFSIARQSALVLDPVYNAKAYTAMMLQLNEETSGRPTVYIHTGGLQGLRASSSKLLDHHAQEAA